MSYRHLKYDYRKSASKLHRQVGDILRAHPIYNKFNILQEYPIPNTAYRIDWFIRELQLAIEVHGEQHFMPVCFGGISETEALQKLKEQIDRDRLKKQLCIDNSWKYITLAYNDSITKELLENRITKGLI